MIPSTLTGEAAPVSSMLKLDSLVNERVPGVTLRRTSGETSKTAAGDSVRITTTMNVSAIQSDSVESRDFEIPPGYNVMDMSRAPIDMTSDAAKAALAGVESKQQESMKKMLCGAPDPRKP